MDVLVVGSDPLARSGLASVLTHRDDLRVSDLGTTDTGEPGPEERIVDTIVGLQPDVALWDFGGDGEGTRPPLAALDDAGIPVIAMVPDDTQAGDALAAGAVSILYRDTDTERLAAAINATANGLMTLDRSIADALLDTGGDAGEPFDDPLTPREHDVVQLLAEGLSNKALAARLGISEHTAKFHVNTILRKLDARGRTEAVVRAAQRGLIVL